MEFVIEEGILKKCVGEETELTIPDGVTVIQNEVFDDCKNLKSITLPDSIKEVYKYALRRDKLSNEKFICNLSPKLYVRLIKKTRTVGGQCIYRFPGQPDFIIVKGTLYYYQGTETKITIPENVSSIYDSTFYEDPDLEEVTIPSNVKEIGRWTFYWCRKLRKVIFEDNGIRKIEEQCFMNCSNLEEVRLPAGLEIVGHAAFEGTKSLKTINFPETVWSFMDTAFTDSGLSSISFSKNVKYIGSYSFKHLKNLSNKTITVPDSCNVDKNAFDEGVAIIED